MEVQIRYFAPARFYDLLRIFIEVIKLGNSSLHLRYKIVKEKTKEEILQATQVLVQIDPRTQKSTPWSDVVRSVLIKEVKNEV